jgi:tellurite resistance protein
VLEQVDPAGIAAFVTALAAVIALANSRPAQWGTRRIAFGVAVCAGVVMTVMLTGVSLLYAILFWGGYQIYVGWAFMARRSSISSERRQYVTATARVLSYVALCDGMITPKESEIIRAAFARAGFSPEEVKEVDLTMHDCAQAFAYDGSDPERLAGLLKEACATVARHSDNQTRFLFLRTALKIAASDGFVSLAEEKALRAATTWLGLTTEDIDDAWSETFGGAERDPATTSAGRA